MATMDEGSEHFRKDWQESCHSQKARTYQSIVANLVSKTKDDENERLRPAVGPSRYFLFEMQIHHNGARNMTNYLAVANEAGIDRCRSIRAPESI
jgi:hypothetical protein